MCGSENVMDVPPSDDLLLKTNSVKSGEQAINE